MLKTRQSSGVARVAVGIAMALVASYTMAADTSGVYAGVAIGSSGADFKDAANVYPSTVPSTAASAKDRNSAAGRLILGYAMGPHLAIEAGAGVLGKFSTSRAEGGAALKNEIKVSGVTLDVIGSIPLTDAWSVYAGVGAAYMKVHSEAMLSGGAQLAPGVANKRSQSAFSPHAKLGVSYAFRDRWTARLEMDGYKDLGKASGKDAVGRGDGNSWTAGVVYRF